MIYRFETSLKVSTAIETGSIKQLPSLRKLTSFYLLFALVTICAAFFLPYFAEGLAIQTGLDTSFVGTVFLAASTSLPEIAVSVSAVRFGSYDLAVGNLFGSNIFNILILTIDDIFYTKGVLLKDASDNHLLSIFACLSMSAIAIAGFTFRSPAKKFMITIDSLLILAFYLVTMVLLFFINQ
jgi:cation:H+ antiporter